MTKTGAKKPHRGGRNGSHALAEPMLGEFLDLLDKSYKLAGSYRILAAPFGGSPSESTMQRWLRREGFPSAEMAVRVAKVLHDPFSDPRAMPYAGESPSEPLAPHLRDVPTGDHPEPVPPEPAQKFIDGHGGAGGIRQPETTPDDIRRMIAEELAGSDFAGAILNQATKLIPQIMLADYTHPADASEAMTAFVQVLMSARDRLAEQSYARGRNNGAGGATKRMQPVLDKLTNERDEAVAKLAQVQSAVPAGMALARAEVSYHRDTLIAVSKFLADRSRSAPQGA